MFIALGDLIMEMQVLFVLTKFARIKNLMYYAQLVWVLISTKKKKIAHTVASLSETVNNLD